MKKATDTRAARFRFSAPALCALLLACAAAVASAQSGGAPLTAAVVREQAGALPETVMRDVPMPLFRAVKGIHNIKRVFPWGMPEAGRLRTGVLADDQLDNRERELLAEFQKPFFHVRLVALKSPIFAPDDLVLAGAFTPEARAELATFAPLEGRAQRALWLDSNAAGWAKAAAYARQGDEQREEIIDLLVEMLREAANRSTLENSFTPFRDRLQRFHNVAGAQARITLLRTAADIVHDSGRGIPLFLVSWIKRGDDETVAHLLPPDFVAALREMASAKPFPWGETEAEKIAALVSRHGKPDMSMAVLLRAFTQPKFRTHLVARTPPGGGLDRLDLDGSFAPGSTAALQQLIPRAQDAVDALMSGKDTQ